MIKLIELIVLEAEKNGKSNRDLAKCIGVSEPTMYRLLKSGDFTLKQADSMAKMLNISVWASVSEPVKVV